MKRSKKFKFQRNQLGWTQVQAAKYLGITSQTISRWERGVVECPTWAIQMLKFYYKERD